MRSSTDNLNSSANPIAEIESKAQELARVEKWSEAARLLTTAARAEPDNTARWLQIAQWQRQSREPQAAAKTLLNALRLNAPRKSSPRTSSSRTSLPRNSGKVSAVRQEKPEQMQGKDTSQLKTDELVAIWQALAETQLEAQAWSECINACRSLLRLAPNHHYGQELLATALLHAGRVDESIEVMRGLLTLSPRDPLHRIKLATLLQLQNRSGEALLEFQRVLAAYPDAPFAAEAFEAVEVLDRIQIQQILLRATEEGPFRLQLLHEMEETLIENDFHLSEGGLESLRYLLWDGNPDVMPATPTQVH